MSLDTSVLSDGPNSKRYMHTVNSLKDGHLWEGNLAFLFERYPSHRESNKGSKEMQGPSLGAHFTKLSQEEKLPCVL